MSNKFSSKADKNLMLTRDEVLTMAPAFDENLLFFLERRYFDVFPFMNMQLADERIHDKSFDFKQQSRFFRIDSITYDTEFNEGVHLANMNNILASLSASNVTIAMIVHGTLTSTNIYYGLISHDQNFSGSNLSSLSTSFQKSFKSQFSSVDIATLSSRDTGLAIIEPLVGTPGKRKILSAITGIPSVRRGDNKTPFVQGLDRFMESMRGDNYILLSIATPVELFKIDELIQRCRDISGEIHSQVKATISRSKSSSITVNTGATDTSGSATTGSVSVGHSLGPTSISTSFARTTLSMLSTTLGGGYSKSRSKSVSQETYNKTAEYCEQLCSQYIQRLNSGKNLGFWNNGIYLMTEEASVQVRGIGQLRSLMSGGDTHWEPIRSLELPPEARTRYIERFLNPRFNTLEYGYNKPENIKEQIGLDKFFSRLAQKAGESFEAFMDQFSQYNNEKKQNILEEYRSMKSEISDEEIQNEWEKLKQGYEGHPFGEIMSGLGTLVNTEELSITMNVPRKEVQGVSIRPSASFGVNYHLAEQENGIRLGRIVHKRVPVDSMPYILPRDHLQKHLFVCGVTGSGKSNTCMGLLSNLNCPFMVIEPAKAEYRQLLTSIPTLKIFTLGEETVSPFRINPFEFSSKYNLLSHIDNLKSVFNAAFPMYAAMPYILEEAIIEVYQDKGWELATSTNIYLHNDVRDNLETNNNCFHNYLPTMQDLYDKIDDVVSRKKYAQEQTLNYSAAIKARISSLLTGSKGLMLNTRRSTPIEILLSEQVVLELKNIGDDDEKCFLMGLLLSAIYEYRECHGTPCSSLKHVLLIEEAHRLLRRVPEYISPEVGNTRGKAVETFSNVISEIRTFGQGLVIVDQIPSKLTQDVIKNTNMKIVHRTLAKDDRDYVGSTMNLEDQQSRELCLLEVGQAVIHREGMDKPFLVQVDSFISENSPFVDNQSVKKQMSLFHQENAFIFHRYPGFEKHPDIFSIYNRIDFRTIDCHLFYTIMGGFVLMLLDATEHLPDLRKGFNELLRRRFRKTSELEQACYAIHYAALLFSELNAKYPGCYDRCMSMNQTFVDFWFNSIPQGKSSNNVIFDNALKKQIINKLCEDMRYLRNDDKLTIPFFAYYLNRIEPEISKTICVKWEGTETNFKELDAYLREALKKLLPGTTVQETILITLACDLLCMIFWTDPRRLAIMKTYMSMHSTLNHS